MRKDGQTDRHEAYSGFPQFFESVKKYVLFLMVTFLLEMLYSYVS
jgi:hypothetical protein